MPLNPDDDLTSNIVPVQRPLRRIGEPAADAEDETAEPPEDVFGRQHGQRGGQPAALAEGEQAGEQGRQPRQELERLRDQVRKNVRCDKVQTACAGCPTGNGEKLSSSQAEPGQAITSDVA